MTTFRNLVLAAATAAAALAAGASASAQDYRGGFGPGDRAYTHVYRFEARDALRERISRLERRIDAARRYGRLDREDGWRLGRELGDLRREAWRSDDGYELNRVALRLDRLENRLERTGRGK